MKLTSQIFSLTSLMPTFWPANTVLRLIFASTEADAAAVGDRDGAIVEGILEVAQALIGPRLRAE